MLPQHLFSNSLAQNTHIITRVHIVVQLNILQCNIYGEQDPPECEGGR